MSLVSDVYVPSLDECAELAQRMTCGEMIEREQAAGQPFGPVHRQWQLERAPEKVLRLLEQSALRPDLIAGQSDFMSPVQQFPGASLATVNTTVTETNLWNPAILCPVPISAMRAGARWQVTFGGVMGTTATPTVVYTARFGTNNSVPPTGTTLGAGPTVTLGTFTAQPFFGIAYVGIRQPGVAASTLSLACTGFVAMSAAAAATVTPHAVFGGGLPTTIDASTAQGISVSIIWGASSASNTITCQYVDPLYAG
jgi:hypothetical protein